MRVLVRVCAHAHERHNVFNLYFTLFILFAKSSNNHRLARYVHMHLVCVSTALHILITVRYLLRVTKICSCGQMVSCEEEAHTRSRSFIISVLANGPNATVIKINHFWVFVFYWLKTACAALSKQYFDISFDFRFFFWETDSCTPKPGNNLFDCAVLACGCMAWYVCIPIYFNFLSGSNVVIVGSNDFFSLDNLSRARNWRKTLCFFFSLLHIVWRQQHYTLYW